MILEKCEIIKVAVMNLNCWTAFFCLSCRQKRENLRALSLYIYIDRTIHATIFLVQNSTKKNLYWNKNPSFSCTLKITFPMNHKSVSITAHSKFKYSRTPKKIRRTKMIYHDFFFDSFYIKKCFFAIIKKCFSG